MEDLKPPYYTRFAPALVEKLGEGKPSRTWLVESPATGHRGLTERRQTDYFAATGCFLPFSCRSLDFCNFFTNRSTRPSVSISFCRPVKNGWQLEQISTRRSPLWVERVGKLCPQAQRSEEHTSE